MKRVNNKEYDVIVIGGGITGAGTARDCAMRGLSTLLIERYDFTTGATGRNHGLLHSGARYAVTDHESAAECISENMILRKIARHCVDETDGLFITLPEDDLNYLDKFVTSCRDAGINAERIDPALARAIEPAVNPELTGAARVPDASIDPFMLTTANVVDARLHGADVLTYNEVTSLIIEQNRVVGVNLRDTHTGEESEARASITINAAGVWGMLIARMAGITVNMFPAKGSLLVFGHRVNNVVINRCHKPSNADILVPDDTVCVIGTTSDRVPIEECDNMRVTAEEVDVLLSEGIKLAPALATTRILRAYAGVRPLVASDADPSGRSISRGIVCLDHEERDGMAGFITITGGKMMTYRLMAEEATNLACRKLGNTKQCATATTPLPGSDVEPEYKGRFGDKASAGRHGSMAKGFKATDNESEALICECEGVSVGEVNAAIDQLHVKTLVNLRRRTRMGMGTCQGQLCACRAAGLLCKRAGAKKELADLAAFVGERWKGMRPVAWGDTLAESQLMSMVYEELCGLDEFQDNNNPL